jgi:hypothetical protein
MKILVNTLLEGFLDQRYDQDKFIWQALALSSYLAVLVLWGNALANPLPAIRKQVIMLTDSVYAKISVEINRQLRVLNQALVNFWKTEEPPQ